MAATGNLGTVVVAVDRSEESMNALRWALRNLRLRPASDTSSAGTLVVLHVQSPPTIATGLNPGDIPFGGPTHLEVPAFAAAIEAHQKRITEAIVTHALKICGDYDVNVKTEVVVGDPKEQICEVTANLQADLLVMGCRAFGPIKRMFLGSVSNYCINHVSCPVIVIKGDTSTSEQGLVLRDEVGLPMFVATYLNTDTSARNAELWAIMKGLQLLDKLGRHNVTIETDCLSAVTLLYEVQSEPPWQQLF